MPGSLQSASKRHYPESGHVSQSDDAELQSAVPIGGLTWFGMDGEEINKVETKTTFARTDDPEHLCSYFGRE